MKKESTYVYDELKEKMLSFEKYKEVTLKFQKHNNSLVNTKSDVISDEQMNRNYVNFKIGYLDCCAKANELNNQIMESVMKAFPPPSKNRIRKQVE